MEDREQIYIILTKMQEEISNKYISLYEAEKYCPYSQEYLSLRARQGKFRAVKIGRNWLTTREWVEEYIAKIEAYNGDKSIVRITEKREPFLEWKQVSPPDNLPVEFLPASFISQGPLVPVPDFSEIKFAEPVLVRPLAVRSGFLFALAFLLIFSGLVFGIDSLDKTFGGALYSVKEEAAVAKSQMLKTRIYSATSATIGYTLETFKEYGKWLKGRIVAFAQGIREVSGRLARNVKSFFAFKKEPEKGMVVRLSGPDDEEAKKRIRDNFSDEIRVEIKDESSGLIIPIFREREGDKYMYMLVPIRN